MVKRVYGIILLITSLNLYASPMAAENGPGSGLEAELEDYPQLEQDFNFLFQGLEKAATQEHERKTGLSKYAEFMGVLFSSSGLGLVQYGALIPSQASNGNLLKLITVGSGLSFMGFGLSLNGMAVLIQGFQGPAERTLERFEKIPETNLGNSHLKLKLLEKELLDTCDGLKSERLAATGISVISAGISAYLYIYDPWHIRGSSEHSILLVSSLAFAVSALLTATLPLPLELLRNEYYEVQAERPLNP